MAEETQTKFMAKDFPQLLNDNVIRVARGLQPKRVPVWIMRQAGRYLPEFMEFRKNHGFFEIVNTPELACQVTLMPIERFDLDAAIIFSDILVVPQALGMKVTMEPGVGPVIHGRLETVDDVKKLKFDVDVKDAMKGTLDSITLTRHRLNGKVPLLGFSGAPWTLMSYMIEGGGSKTLSKAKKWLYCHPTESAELLKKISDVVINYLVEQVIAGAQMLQIFESHADLLSPHLFLRFCFPILDRIQKLVVRKLEGLGIEPVPMVVFAKGAHYALHELSKLEYEIIGVDWTIEPSVARKLIAPFRVCQGNLDPCALYAPEDDIKDLAIEMMKGFGSQRLICNLGHGIYPDTPIKGVETFIDTVHKYGKCCEDSRNSEFSGKMGELQRE